MGWLWGSTDQSSGKDRLDPSLRDFIDKGTSHDPPPRQSQSVVTEASEPPKPSNFEAPAQKHSSDNTTPVVPKASQFQDGRYAHLWKNYEPIAELEARGKSEQEKLQDVIETYNSRKSRIGQIAEENCSAEYMNQYNCFKNPTWAQMANACQGERKKFTRCYTMQSKFLLALGYLTMEDRSEEEYVRIQFHADKLYRQMLEQDEAMKKAKEEGQPIPEFPSVLSKSNISQAMNIAPPTAAMTNPDSVSPSSTDDDDVWKLIKPDARAEYEKKFATLPKEEQELERRAVEGELRARNSMTKSLESAFVEERLQRMRRRETGQSTFGDMIKTWWGWG